MCSLRRLFVNIGLLKKRCVENRLTHITQEAQLMLSNPRDVFIGQSRSTNIVTFHMVGIVSCVQ